jgi:hypothetical protein
MFVANRPGANTLASANARPVPLASMLRPGNLGIVIVGV